MAMTFSTLPLHSRLYTSSYGSNSYPLRTCAIPSSRTVGTELEIRDGGSPTWFSRTICRNTRPSLVDGMDFASGLPLGHVIGTARVLGTLQSSAGRGPALDCGWRDVPGVSRWADHPVRGDSSLLTCTHECREIQCGYCAGAGRGHKMTLYRPSRNAALNKPLA